MYRQVPTAKILSHSPELESYFKWAYDNGIRLNKIAYPVRFPPGYLGTMALETINPGDVLVSVPNSLLISSKTAERSELGNLFIKKYALKSNFSSFSAKFKAVVCKIGPEIAISLCLIF